MISNFPWEEWVNTILQWLMIPGHIPDGHFSTGHFPDGHFPDLTHPRRTLLRLIFPQPDTSPTDTSLMEISPVTHIANGHFLY